MDAIECLKTRRSVRQFRRDPVPDEVVADLVDCGRLAPTGRGVQPWDFIVVRDPAVRAQLAAMCEYGKFIADAPVCIIVVCEDTKYYIEDGSAATTCILLAARAHGLGSCWVAGDKKPYANEVCDLLGCPPTHRLVSLIAVGYTDQCPTPTKRPLESVMHSERF